MTPVDFRIQERASGEIHDVDPEFQAFYRRTSRHVMGALRRAGVREEADQCDLAQDVYIVAYRRLSTKPASTPEGPWVGRIARHVAWHHMRSRSRKDSSMHAPDSIDLAIAAEPGPDTRALQRNYYYAVMECLDEQEREVFEMVRVEGCTTEEVSAALKIPLGTVKERLRRANKLVDEAVRRLEARENAAILPVGGWPAFAELFEEDLAPGMEDRVLDGVCRTLAAEALFGGVSAAAGAASKGLLFGSGAATGGVAVGGAVALYVLLASPGPPLLMPETRPAVAAQAAGATATAALETPNPEPSAAAQVPAAPPQRTPGGQIHPDEPLILGRARAAIANGDVEAANQALGEHEARFPRSDLRHERAILRAKIAQTVPKGRAPHRLMDVDR